MLCPVTCLHLYSPRFVYPQSPACRSKPYLARLDKPNDLDIKIKAAKHQDFHQTKRRCDYYDLSNKLIPYMDAWTWQKQMVEAKHALMEADEDVCDTVMILQHPPVYTLGTRSSDKFLHFDIHSPPYDIYRTERGGEVTYHGPGQLVMYPIMNLHYHKMDLHWYLRSLEEVIIRALWSAFSLEACRIDGLTGVWVGNQKVAAIGIRVSRWVTYHGLAINITTDLTPFTKIVPCGISDRSVGSLFEILESSASLQHVASPSLEGREETWDSCTLLDLTHKSLLKEFSEVFQVDLIPKFLGNLSCISTSNILEEPLM